MKTVIRKMQDQTVGQGLWKTLAREGWQFCEGLTREESDGYSRRQEPCLVITDSPEGAEYARGRDLTCLAYEPLDGPFRFYGVDMVAQDLDELNGEFLNLVWKRHCGIPWRIAVTKRLILRESVLEDLDEFYSLYQGEGMTDYIPDMPQDREQERRDMAHYIKQVYGLYNYGLWTVVERMSGQVVGRAGLEHSQDPESGEPVLELGYLIGRPWQRQGYGTEAAVASASYAFRTVGIDKLYLFIHPGNEASLRVSERLTDIFGKNKIRVILLAPEKKPEKKTR